jgi:hypothetical protein
LEKNYPVVPKATTLASTGRPMCIVFVRWRSIVCFFPVVTRVAVARAETKFANHEGDAALCAG